MQSSAARDILLFNPSHDSAGRFAESAGAAAGAIASKLKSVAAKTAWAPYHLEHAATKGIKALAAYAADVAKSGGSGYDKPGMNPDSLAGKTIGGLKMAAASTLKVAYAPWIAGAKAVEGVARAKGLSSEEAAKVRTLVTCYDAINCKAIVLGLEHAGMTKAAGLSTLIPTASVAYLVHAGATDFPAVMRAAKVGIANAAASLKSGVGKVRGKLGLSRDDDATAVVGTLADAVKAHSGDAFYWALLCAAMDEADSADEAVTLADKAYTTSPSSRTPIR